MLQTELRKTVDIELLHDNPRTIEGKDFKKLCQSLRDNPEFFQARPIILSNRTGMLVAIAGNMRLRGAIEIGMKEVPTVLIPNLTEEQEKEIIIRDNVSNGKWDWDILSNEWDEEKLTEWGVDFPFFDPDVFGESEEDDNEEEEGSANYSNGSKIVIELGDDSNKEAIEAEIEELLRSYPEAKMK